MRSGGCGWLVAGALHYVTDTEPSSDSPRVINPPALVLVSAHRAPLLYLRWRLALCGDCYALSTMPASESRPFLFFVFNHVIFRAISKLIKLMTAPHLQQPGTNNKTKKKTPKKIKKSSSQGVQRPQHIYSLCPCPSFSNKTPSLTLPTPVLLRNFKTASVNLVSDMSLPIERFPGRACFFPIHKQKPFFPL